MDSAQGAFTMPGEVPAVLLVPTVLLIAHGLLLLLLVPTVL
jgi:hypothetical protein